jgi:TolB-like protein
MKKLKTAVLSVLLVALSTSVFAAAKTVAIVPFKVNAEKDMSFLRDGVYDMLSTRLARDGEVEVLNRQTVEKALPPTPAPLTEASGRELGRKLAADYVLFGSLTVLGNSISLDSKMVDVAGAKPTMSFFEQSEDAGGIIARINAMAAAVNEKMFGRATAVAQPQVATPAAAAATAPQSQAAQPAPADPFAHPEKLLKQPSGFGGESKSPFAASEESSREFSPQFWKSAAYKLAFNGIALGDVDGDGKTETVIITADKIIVYRYEQQRFYQVSEYDAGSNGINIGVDVADINANGVPEIIVTRLTLTRKVLASFVLEWDGKAFKRIVDNASWYFRVCDLPDRGKILLGQEPRFGSPFKGKISEMIWRNGQYEPETPVTVSTEANVLGLTIGQIVKGQRETIAAYDASDRIRVFDEAGKEEWKSSEKYGGSTLNTLGNIDDQGDTERPIYLPMRLVAMKPDKDGKSQVLAIRNFDITDRKLEKFRSYNEAQIIGFGWDGLGLQSEWKTRKMTGCIRDFALGDFDNDGELEMVCALVLDEGRIITTIPKSTVIALKFAK